MRRRVLVPVTLLVLAAAAPLAAQDPDRPGITEVRGGGDGPSGGRGGFWASIGGGLGRESVDLDGDGLGYSRALDRPTLSIRLGGTVNQNLRLGVDLSSWLNDEGGALESVTSALLLAQLYPAGSSGLHLRGGLGLGRSGVDFEGGGGVWDTGVAGMVGAGWEVRVGRRIFLVPSVDFTQYDFGGRSGLGYRERVLNFGISVLAQSGR